MLVGARKFLRRCVRFVDRVRCVSSGIFGYLRTIRGSANGNLEILLCFAYISKWIVGFLEKSI